MGRQGKKITEEEATKIMECLGRKMSPRQMSHTVKRSANAIYAYLRKTGHQLPMANKYHPDRVYSMAEEVDYSGLPDNVLFNSKNFPSF